MLQGLDLWVLWVGSERPAFGSRVPQENIALAMKAFNDLDKKQQKPQIERVYDWDGERLWLQWIEDGEMGFHRDSAKPVKMRGLEILPRGDVNIGDFPVQSAARLRSRSRPSPVCRMCPSGPRVNSQYGIPTPF